MADKKTLDLIKKEQHLRLAKSLANCLSDELKAEDAFILGLVLIIRKLWEEINLGGIISEVCGNEEISERVFCAYLFSPLTAGIRARAFHIF